MSEKNYRKSRQNDTEDVVIVGESKRKVNQKLPERQMPELSFDAWWARTQKKYKLAPEMKEVIYKHLKARGFVKNGQFDEGLKDFGIKS